jgi:hypothetical protein
MFSHAAKLGRRKATIDRIPDIIVELQRYRRRLNRPDFN